MSRFTIGAFAIIVDEQRIPHNTPLKQVERIRDALKVEPGVVLKTRVRPSSLDLLQRGEL